MGSFSKIKPSKNFRIYSILMGSSTWYDTIDLGWFIVYIKKSQVKFQTKIVFLTLRIVLVLANSVDPDNCAFMQHFIWVFTVCQSTHLEVSSRQKFRD